MAQATARFPIPPVDDIPLYDLDYRKYISPVLNVVQDIGLFEYLAKQPASIQEVATHYQVLSRAAEAVVAVAAASGYLEVTDTGAFRLTTLGETYLLSSSPFYRKISSCSEKDYEIFKDAFYKKDGEDSDRRLAVDLGSKNQEAIKGFIALMHSITLPAAGTLAKQEIFKHIHSLLDVAGGSGSLISAIADNNSQLRCTLLDLDPVCAIARDNIASFGLESRITTVSADMFQDPWPTGYDALLFGNIFHDWETESCVELAKKAYRFLEPGGYILLHEMPLNETKDGPLSVACSSALMLTVERGKQYTLSELEWILSQAGFRDFSSTPSYGYYHLISARK